MRRRTAAALFFGGTIGMSSIGYAVAPPVDAHQAFTLITEETCRDNGTWSFRLGVTSDVAGGLATIGTPQSPITDAPLPFGPALFIVPGNQTSYKVTVRVRWPDGFVSPAANLPPISYTAHRPDVGCTPPTTQPGTTTTTTCAQAIPPRADCGPVTEVTTSTSSSSTTTPTSGTTQPETSTTPPASVAGGSPSGPTSTSNQRAGQPTITNARSTLPATGSDAAPLVVVGAAFVLAGVVALLAVRRRWVG